MPESSENQSPPKTGRRYALICPCKDEADHAQATIDSLAAQSEPPTLCLFVDDGSTDDTPERVRAYGVRVVRHGERRGCGPAILT